MSKLSKELEEQGQIVLVFQGGGALGAYQVGVYQALHEAGIQPDWVVGTSIGAINASLIAGSPFSERLDRMNEFWKRVETGSFLGFKMPDWFGQAARNMLAITTGVPSFFQPRPAAFISPHAPLGPDDAGYYSIAPLREILNELIDFDRINDDPMRLSVGASKVQSSEMVYFDTKDRRITVDHILASGALPPAFPAIRIDGELYWDGGILSNTPVELVFDDLPRQSGTIFTVHLWNPHGQEPETIWQVMNRQKDLQYSSRAESHIMRQRQLHRLRHVITELGKMIPPDIAEDPRFADLMHYGCDTRMQVIRLLAPALDNEDHSKDIDFSPEGIRQRREAGYRHTCQTLEAAPWRDTSDLLGGFILHEAYGGEMVHTSAAVG
jgi:NTE family protein